jgi:hypothetical protein
MKKATTTEKERAADLISKYLLNALSRHELADLEAWIKESPWNRAKFEELTNVDMFFAKLKMYIRELEWAPRSRIQNKNGISQKLELPEKKARFTRMANDLKLTIKTR